MKNEILLFKYGRRDLVLIIIILIYSLNTFAQEQRIFGGIPIEISEVPWQVSVERHTDVEKHWCGGTIINSEWVLSAAHCYKNPDGTNVTGNWMIHAGATDQTQNNIGQRISVDQIILHPNFNNIAAAGFDLALLHLSEPLCFNNDVQPIGLATTEIMPGTIGLVTGWGATITGGDMVNSLLQVSLPVISDSYANSIMNNETNACPQFYNIGGTAIALYQQGLAAGPGDSGGPMVVFINGTPVLAAITSWGGCPRNNFPTVCADVYALSGFITNNIDNSTVCNSYSIPQLSTYALPNSCSQLTYNLNSVEILNEIPCNTIVVWSLDDNPNDGISVLPDTEISEPGNYYAYFYNATHDCYSSPSQPFVVNFCNVMDLEISSNYLIDSDQEFNKIVIESNGVLTITSNVTVKLVDKIEIKYGGKLIVNGATLTNCPCVSTWQGIKAWGNPYTNQSHAVELINGAIIENAEIGINTSNIVPGFFPGTFVDLSGAKITSDNSTIRNCEVGVNFGPYGYSTWFSSYDQSYFNNTVFESCGTGAILNSNAGIEFLYSSFTGGNSIGIDLRNSNAYVSGCDFSGYQGILFSAIWPNLLGSEVINNAFLNGINGDGIMMDAQGNASSHYIAGNFFESISGIHGLGQSYFNIQANDFVNNIVGVSSWYTGDDYNLVSDNDFLGNEYGNSAYGNNSIEYLRNCFDYSGTADIELYSGASIFQSQGDVDIAADNCFSYLTNRILTGFGSVPFDYFVKAGTNVQSCKHPGYGNFNVELSDQEFGLNCGSGVWNSLPPRYRNCVIPASLEDKKLMQTALEKEIDRIKKDPNISQSLKKWLIARYERCLKSLKGAKGLQIIREEQDGKERGIEYFSNQSLFSHKIMAYAIMMESGELTRASTYLNSLITENSAEVDFIDASNLYITYLSDRNNFVLSEIARESLRYKAMQPNELSGYIRSIYHALTGERISIVLPHTNLSGQGITNTIESQVDKISSYPNPVIDDEHIVFIPEIEVENKISINLIDMTGRIIESISGHSGENRLDMSHVPLGLYIVEVVSDDIRIYTTKVVKL